MTTVAQRAGVLACAMTLGLTACSSKSQDNGSGVPGVSADEITLGVLPDITGPFALVGRPSLQGTELFWENKNEEGGVCGRTVDLEVQDTGYDPQKAVALYRDMAPNILGIQMMMGTPIAEALLPSLEADHMLTSVMSWSSSLLQHAELQITGSTYDIQMINGLARLAEEGLVSEGDTVVHVYLEGDFGENALRGAKFAAEELGLELLERKVDASQSDMSAQVAELRRTEPAAVLLTTTPSQTASLAGAADAAGLDAPLLGVFGTFNPSLLDSQAGTSLVKNLWMATPAAPLSLDSQTVSSLAEDLQSAYPDAVPSMEAASAYAFAQITAQAIETACADGAELSREGLVEALRSLSDVDTGGIVAGPLDFTTVGSPSSLASYISRPQAEALGGLVAVDPEPYVADIVADYSVE